MLLPLALSLAAAALSPGDTHVHDARIDHHRGPLDATYRGRMVVAHRQIGAVAPGGRPSTLRCLWQADVVVDRVARHGSGATLQRSITRPAALSGSRHGWCDDARGAIEREVAAREGTIREHVAAVAAEDRTALIAEADRLHTGTPG